MTMGMTVLTMSMAVLDSVDNGDNEDNSIDNIDECTVLAIY